MNILTSRVKNSISVSDVEFLVPVLCQNSALLK